MFANCAWCSAAAAGQVVAAIGAVWAVCVACSNANKERKVDIAPQRATIFRLCSLLVDCLENALVSYSDKETFSKDVIRSIMQDWMLSIERDERFLYLKRLNVLVSSHSGIAIGCYRDLMPQIQVVLADVPFYFDSSISEGVSRFLKMLEECEKWIPDDVNEIDAQKELGGLETEISQKFFAVVRTMNDALEAMRKDLKLG